MLQSMSHGFGEPADLHCLHTMATAMEIHLEMEEETLGNHE